MSNEIPASESWNVIGKAEKTVITDNKAPIIQNPSGTVNINYGLSGKNPLEGNPFVPPQPREGNLIGRETELTKLHELLQTKKNVCVVSGMGGVGKTELVREYVTRDDCKAHFSGGVFYVDARSRENIAAEIVAVTEYHFQAQIEDGLSDTQKVTQCWEAWKTQTESVLLILDDVSGLAKNFKLYLRTADLGKLRLLITSRDTPDQRIAEELPLEVLLPESAVELLASIIGQERVVKETSAAEKLCEELGYLPLALELVGYYLEDEDYQSLSLAAMGDKLKEKVKHPSLSPEEVPMAIKATRGVQAAFDLSWDELTPEAKYLACVLGAFASAAIHWGFVGGIYENLQGESFSEDNLKDKWLKSLRKLHLVLTVETDIYDLHPLIRDYFGEQFKQHPQHSEIKQAFCDLSVRVADAVEQSTTLAVFNLIEPHLKKMIDWCEGNEDRQFAFSLNQLARLYNSQGKYNEAEPLYLRSLSIREKKLGENHPDVAQSLNNLAELYRNQGKYNEAEPLYRRSLSIWEKQLGENHPDFAISLNNLALLYNSQGKYNEAEPLFLRSLSIRENQLGEDHPDVANSLNNLALLYNYQGKYKVAEPLFLRSLSIREKQLGENHPDVANSLNNLAKFYRYQGKYNEAEPLCLRSLSIYENQLGEDHPDVASSLSGLAELYNSQGKYNEAEPLCLRSLAIREKQLGENHPDVANSLNNLALLYNSQGKYNKAEPLYRRSLSIDEKQLGEDHPNVATTLNNLANLYNSQGKYNEAEPLYRRSLSIREKQLGENHPDVAQSLNNLAELYKSQGKYNEAEPLYLRSLSIYEKQLGENHPDVATTLNNLAGLYQNQGKYNEAEPLYLRSLSIKESQLGENHPDVAIILNNLAELYNSQGKYDEAEPLYLRSLSILEKQLGENHPQVVTSLNNLAFLYNAQGNYAEAKKLSQQALTIRQQTLGDHHPDTQESLLATKMLNVQILLDCDTQTLLGILEAFAQLANLPDPNTETMLMLLETIATNPKLLQSLREALHG
jgi:tetratricopeptide (TPR) repeat protein